MIDTIHATHTCFICQHPMAWVGNVFGGLTISHGNEVDAEVTVSAGENQVGLVKLGIQLQCPECGSVNQFDVLHRL